MNFDLIYAVLVAMVIALGMMATHKERQTRRKK